MFKIIKKSKISKARIGELKTNHGKINAPFFMPIATRGAVKNLTPEEIKEIGAEIILSNTYHLLARPGLETISKLGGVHKLIGWSGPILTDSGGYQVFSLSKLLKLNDQGIEFSSPEAGNKIFLTPEKALEFQIKIGSDICMVLDECAEYTKDKNKVEKAVKRTSYWAKRSKDLTSKQKNKKSLVFGIIQGGIFQDLRKKSLDELISLGFDGYAIGGLSVGEPFREARKILKFLSGLLPENKPRYLMGVGFPEQIVEAVKHGIDMFDCVIPTRHARHGEIFVFKNRNLKGNNFYEIISIAKSKHKNDFKPFDKNCDCYTCKNFNRAQLHHLFKVKELLYQRLATIHNLKFYMELMQEIKNGIKKGKI
jgi:queuine tRNA-ribosyltransferase